MLRWVMELHDVDGVHVLKTATTYKSIKRAADKWLGDNALWESRTKAVSMYGSVVYLQTGMVEKCRCCRTKSVLPSYGIYFCDTCYHTVDALVCSYCPKEPKCKNSFLKGRG